MEIIVCVKSILDPDLPPAKFAVDLKSNRVIPPEGMPPVMNPYDALAVEAALRIKEAKKVGKVTVLTVGDASADGVIRKALAMGADEALILSDPAFTDSDGFATARLLAQAVQKLGPYDLILCGRQAADWDQGMVGSVLAEFLGIPVITRAKAIEAGGGKIKVDRVVADGFETFEVALPALITVSSEFGQARIPSGWGIIKAAKKPIPAWGASQVGAGPSGVGKAGARNSLVKLFVPSYQRKCQMVTGETPAEAAAKLADKIAGFKA
jgi:electron transfer flavoprotein beta subunit